MLSWVNRFNIFCLLDNHQYPSSHHHAECLLAVGAVEIIQANAGNAFTLLKGFSDRQQDWLFGHLGFELKEETEQVISLHNDRIKFPDLFFFRPLIVILLNEDSLSIGSLESNHQDIFDEILQAPVPADGRAVIGHAAIRSVFSKSAYIETVESLRQHILRGDCYEINFCQEFFFEDVALDPLQTYRLLSETSPTPFAAFYRLEDKYLFCASPERYICRKGSHLSSQPIKGTWPRNTSDAVADHQNKEKLYHSAKDRSENVMVVDLVRNDLSKICKEGSVHVDELYGIYTFPQVHQMISSVSGEQLPGTHWVDVIKATFPMGSMTGAPKKRVLELIAQYEKSRRGIFSGSVGYVRPNGDFDFNVIIRSIFYNQHTYSISYQVGSGITFYSDAEKEYEECLLKAAAIEKVLLG